MPGKIINNKIMFNPYLPADRQDVGNEPIEDNDNDSN